MTKVQDVCLDSKKLSFPDTPFVTIHERKYYQTQLTANIAKHTWYKQLAIDALLRAQDVLLETLASDVKLIVKGSTALKWALQQGGETIQDSDLDTMLVVRPGSEMHRIAHEFLAGTFLDWIHAQTPERHLDTANTSKVEHVDRPSMFIDYPNTATHWIQTRRVVQENVRPVQKNGRVGIRSAESGIRTVSFSNNWHKTYDVEEYADGYVWFSSKIEAMGTITALLPDGTSVRITEDGKSPLRVHGSVHVQGEEISVMLNGIQYYIGTVREQKRGVASLDRMYLPRALMCVCESVRSRPHPIQMTIQPFIDTGTATFSLLRLVFPFRILRSSEEEYTKAELLDIACTEGLWDLVTGPDREKWTYQICMSHGTCIRLVTLLYQEEDLHRVLEERPEDKKTNARKNRLKLIKQNIKKK